jgi:predicted ATPase
MFATHSPMPMAHPDAATCRCDGEGVWRIAYEEIENFQVTPDFLVNPRRMLTVLSDD